MRLIDADMLIAEMSMKKEYMTPNIYGYHDVAIEGIIEFVDKYPTVEAKPVVHGSWETELTALLVVYRCSECNCATALGQTNFCPNCGCSMKKE